MELYPQLVVGDLGELYYDSKEPTENTTTWVYEEGHVPISKIVNGEQYSIISDYIGRPIQVFNNVGKIVWETEYDIYGRLKNLKGDREFQPFRQVGQFEDVELEGLYYNRYRFYESSTGLYISQDPIKLLSGELNLYSYVHDNNSWLDILGLTGTYMFTDGKTWYIGKGPEDRMYASMKERVGGKANVTQGIHVDYLDNNKGLMIEAELMRRKDAVMFQMCCFV